VVRTLVVAVAVFAVPAAPAAAATGYAFGREGGNIRPFGVTVTASGAVRVTGPVTVGRTQLTAAQLAAVASAASGARFTALPATTRCPGALPDIASLFVTAGGHNVSVHGGCVTRFARVWNALVAAVELRY
jgi:hypothetical protein